MPTATPSTTLPPPTYSVIGNTQAGPIVLRRCATLEDAQTAALFLSFWHPRIVQEATA